MASSFDPWAASAMPTDQVVDDGRTPYTGVDTFPTAVACLDSHDPSVDTNTQFDSFQEAMGWRCLLAKDVATPDDTIPRTVDQKKALVKVIFVAFKSTAKASDNEAMLKPFVEQRHDNKRVEVLCWSMLEALIHRAQYGPLLYAWDPAKAKYNSHLHNFAERFDEMIKSMATSKTICKHLFDAPYMNHFIDDPVNSRKRVLSNRALNKRKGAMMAEGKRLKALKEGVKPGKSSDVAGPSQPKSRVLNFDSLVPTRPRVARPSPLGMSSCKLPDDKFVTPAKPNASSTQTSGLMAALPSLFTHFSRPFSGHSSSASASSTNAYATPSSSDVAPSDTLSLSTNMTPHQAYGHHGFGGFETPSMPTMPDLSTLPDMSNLTEVLHSPDFQAHAPIDPTLFGNGTQFRTNVGFADVNTQATPSRLVSGSISYDVNGPTQSGKVTFDDDNLSPIDGAVSGDDDFDEDTDDGEWLPISNGRDSKKRRH